MSEITAAANFDWGWIKFVGLGLLSPLLLVIGSTILMRYRRNHHHGRKL